jgi:hypothetical protein
MILARHSASKESGSSFAHACAFSGLARCSEITFTTSLRNGRAGTFLGHSSKDFESIGLPSYQHFRPSMIRYDHHFPLGLDGTAALHCCFASTFVTPNDDSAPMQAAAATDGSCFLICSSRSSLVAADGLQRPSHRGVRELLPICRGYAHCSVAEVVGILPV